MVKLKGLVLLLVPGLLNRDGFQTAREVSPICVHTSVGKGLSTIVNRAKEKLSGFCDSEFGSGETWFNLRVCKKQFYRMI